MAQLEPPLRLWLMHDMLGRFLRAELVVSLLIGVPDVPEAVAAQIVGRSDEIDPAACTTLAIASDLARRGIRNTTVAPGIGVPERQHQRTRLDLEDRDD